MLEQQHSQTQGTLGEKEAELEKQRAQLQTIQGSLEEELRKLKGQVTELQEACAKKVSGFSNNKGIIYVTFHMLFKAF